MTIAISGAGTAYSTRNFRLIFASSFFHLNLYAHFAYLFRVVSVSVGNLPHVFHLGEIIII